MINLSSYLLYTISGNEAVQLLGQWYREKFVWNSLPAISPTVKFPLMIVNSGQSLLETAFTVAVNHAIAPEFTTECFGTWLYGASSTSLLLLLLLWLSISFLIFVRLFTKVSTSSFSEHSSLLINAECRHFDTLGVLWWTWWNFETFLQTKQIKKKVNSEG